jgi:hypothetical protein
VDVLSVADLAEGAARLTGDPEQAAFVVVGLDAVDWDASIVEGAIGALLDRSVAVVGHATRPLPAAAAPLLAAFTCTLAPSGPGRTWVAAGADALDRIADTAWANRLATITLAGLLPVSARMSLDDALMLESLAYSTLLAGPEVAAWRARTPIRPLSDAVDPVLLRRDGDVLEVTLNRPDRHNAFGRAVRDGIVAGLELALTDRSIGEVVVRGNGPSFCSGGDLDEFGTAAEPASAHITRLGRSAGRLVDVLGRRIRFEVHGACVGAGVEVPSFAPLVIARADAWFQLPELTMGLVPGAGGTVAITRRIGRWRTAYLALTADRIDLDTALDWGLVDARA